LRTIDVLLRTHQHSWLRGVARRDEVSISKVFGGLIEALAPQPIGRAPTKEYRAHVVITGANLLALERRAVEAGINRSEMARRMIDEALLADRGAR
jgi:hypothetical protein